LWDVLQFCKKKVGEFGCCRNAIGEASHLPNRVIYLKGVPMLVKQLIHETLELQGFCIASVEKKDSGIVVTM